MTDAAAVADAIVAAKLLLHLLSLPWLLLLSWLWLLSWLLLLPRLMLLPDCHCVFDSLFGRSEKEAVDGRRGGETRPRPPAVPANGALGCRRRRRYRRGP